MVRYKSSTKYREKAAKRRLKRLAKQAKKRNQGSETVAGVGDDPDTGNGAQPGSVSLVVTTTDTDNGSGNGNETTVATGDKDKTSSAVQSSSAPPAAATSNGHNDGDNGNTEDGEDGDNVLTPNASLCKNDQPRPQKYSAEDYAKKMSSRNRSLRWERNKFKSALTERETEIAKLQVTAQKLEKTARQSMKQITELNAAMFYILHKGPSPGAAAAATTASASARAAGVAPCDAKVPVDGEADSASPDAFRGGYVSAVSFPSFRLHRVLLRFSLFPGR